MTRQRFSNIARITSLAITLQAIGAIVLQQAIRFA
jgi:hypothetical protein